MFSPQVENIYNTAVITNVSAVTGLSTSWGENACCPSATQSAGCLCAKQDGVEKVDVSRHCAVPCAHYRYMSSSPWPNKHQPQSDPNRGNTTPPRPRPSLPLFLAFFLCLFPLSLFFSFLVSLSSPSLLLSIPCSCTGLRLPQSHDYSWQLTALAHVLALKGTLWKCCRLWEPLERAAHQTRFTQTSRVRGHCDQSCVCVCVCSSVLAYMFVQECSIW